MRRGDFVTVAIQGDYGKSRPALVIQADVFSEHASVTLALVTGTCVEAPLLRVTVAPDGSNGLQNPSQVMVDKVMTVRRTRIGATIGHLAPETMVEVERRLAVFLGIAG